MREVVKSMNKKFHKPPKFTSWLFQKLLPKTDRSYLNGDLDEIYNDIYNRKGWFKALIIAILAVIILAVIVFVLALLGITIFHGLLGSII